MGSQLSGELTEYLENLERSSHSVLAEMEELAREREFPIIGHQCGAAMSALCYAINAKRVFEMGSGFGFSALYFASIVGPDGRVFHTDMDEENTSKAREFLTKAGLANRVTFLNGDATILLAQQDELFDAILIDIDKEGYPLALQLAIKKLRVGGLLFAHNVLWSGKVLDEDTDDPQTKGIRQYNWESTRHADLLTFIDPVHDGLAISVKIDPALRETLPFPKPLL